MNYDMPTPNAEREPHFLTLDEIVDKINSLVDTKTGNCEKPPRIKTGPDGLVLFVEFEVKNIDGSTSLLLYTLDNQKSAAATINITHFKGNPDDGDYLGADTLATYDGKSAQWTDLVAYKPGLHQLSPAVTTHVHNYGINPMPLDAETRQQGQTVIETVQSMEYEELSKLFDQAETVFGTRNMEETLLREASNFQEAWAARIKTKPLLDAIYSKMIALNCPRGRPQDKSLKTWNPSGYLSEGQYSDLNLRRLKLVNALGTLKKDASGGIFIQHDPE